MEKMLLLDNVIFEKVILFLKYVFYKRFIRLFKVFWLAPLQNKKNFLCKIFQALSKSSFAHYDKLLKLIKNEDLFFLIFELSVRNTENRG